MRGLFILVASPFSTAWTMFMKMVIIRGYLDYMTIKGVNFDISDLQIFTVLMCYGVFTVNFSTETDLDINDNKVLFSYYLRNLLMPPFMYVMAMLSIGFCDLIGVI